MHNRPSPSRVLTGLGLLLGACALGGAAVGGPVKVTVRDDKPTAAVEVILPVDPTPRVRLLPVGMSAYIRDEQNRMLHRTHFASMQLDGQYFRNVIVPGGRYEKNNAPLDNPPGAKQRRQGFQSVYRAGDLRVTFSAEMVPGRPAKGAAKRRLDAVLMRYEIENLGKQPHKVGLRSYMDAHLVTNPGPLFAAPTEPGKLLDGVELKGRKLPDYVQLLQTPNLKSPGTMTHLTLDLGNAGEKAGRVVLTRGNLGFGVWDVPVQKANGNSAVALFWEPKALKPGGKRVLTYAYGYGRAEAPGHTGRVELRLGGSFEPGKLFTVTAAVHDPSPGQALTLELPAGLELAEGRATQPVPQPLGEADESVVLWKGRVRTMGTFPLRVRSSTGAVLAKTVTVEKADEPR